MKKWGMSFFSFCALLIQGVNAIAAELSGPPSQQVMQLNTQIQNQFTQFQTQQQRQIDKLNIQIQSQLKQIQSQLQDQIQKLNSQTQSQIQQMQTTLQQQIKLVHEEVMQNKQ